VVAACLAAAALAHAGDRATTAGDDRAFADAIALGAAGHAEESVKRLEALAHEEPAPANAPFALAEAANACERQLYDPAHALRLWDELARRFPDSSLAGRAMARRAALSMGAAPGELSELERIIGEAGARPSAEARARMERFLDQHPGSPHAGEGRLWLAESDLAVNDLAAAEREYQRAAQLHGPEESRAERGLAELLLREGRLDDAGQVYAALGQSSDPIARLAHDAGLEAVEHARRRRLVARLSELALVLIAILGIVVGRRKLWPPPREIRFFAPIALVFAAVGLHQGGLPGRAIGLVAVGATLVVWLTSAATAALRQRSRALAFLCALAALVGVAAVVVLVLRANELTEFAMDTLRAGPER
jgi:hypothetical protein